MAPPAKRRKRNVVESEDEEAALPPLRNSLQNFLSPSSKTSTSRVQAVPPSPVRKTTRSAAAIKSPSSSINGRGAVNKRSAADSPVGTPEKKGKAGKKGKVEEKGMSGNLLALFTKQSQKAQELGRSKGRKSAEPTPLEDLFSDPIESEEDDVAEQKTVSSSFVGKNSQKRFKGSSQSASSSFSTTTHKFLKPPRPVTSTDDDLRPWSERFAPVNLDELAVHKKKVSDVRTWLQDVMNGKMRQRLLVLKGAAGTAKTTTVQLLAKDMQCEVLEWRNPSGALGANLGATSASAQFDEFMLRGGRFGQLEMDTDSPPTMGSSNGSAINGTKDEKNQKLILIEEFPNTFARSSTALTSFRNTILQYLAMNTPALATFSQQSTDDPIIPVVMIISEALLTTTSASADSFTAHRLLGQEILRHPGVNVIEFNAIAISFLAKAMELVVQKEARRSGRRKTPGPQVLKRLGEIGDIRSAISALEFLCLKGDNNADWGAKVAFTKAKKVAKDTALTKGEEESLEMVSRREATLGIFHAVGKVVYNKREDQPFPAGSEEALRETMPGYMSKLSRPKRSQVSVDSLIDEIGTDTHTFISALHENYALSCVPTGPSDPNSSLDYINGCIEWLSESDLLCPAWDIFFGRKGFSGSSSWDTGSHILRQDEMAFQAAVRGLLFSLPSPVKRIPSGGSSGSGRGGDQFKMFYPTYLKLWRAKEETEGLLDIWASKLLHDEVAHPGQPQQSHKVTDGANVFRKSKGGSVGDWAGNRTELNYAAKKAVEKRASEEEPDMPPPPLTLGNVARSEMLLERLPYMALMGRKKKGAFTTTGTKDLEKLVSFQGIGAQPDEEASDEEADETAAPAGEGWATDKPTDEAIPRKKGVGRIGVKNEEGDDSISGGLHISKLVLSDDDIEDD